jgi:thiazole synthase ThiGH ThiG subunit
MSIAEATSGNLQLGTHRFNSRLIVGTGKYPSY